MFKHGEISTEVDTKTFLFTLGAFLGCLTAAVLLFVLGWGDGLAAFAGVLVAVVALASGAVLFAMATDQAYIQDGKLTMRYLFRKNQVSLSEIRTIKFKDNIYSVYDSKEKLLGTINGQLTGVDKIILKLDSCGIYVS